MLLHAEMNLYLIQLWYTWPEFCSCQWCCVQQILHIYCDTVLIIRSKIQYLTPNWSINNENGLCASCLLSNYPKAGIDSRFFASLTEWQNMNRQTDICMQCLWAGENVRSFICSKESCEHTIDISSWIFLYYWFLFLRKKEGEWILLQYSLRRNRKFSKEEPSFQA